MQRLSQFRTAHQALGWSASRGIAERMGHGGGPCEAIDFDPGTIPLPDVTKNTAGYLLRPGMDWVDLFAGPKARLAS